MIKCPWCNIASPPLSSLHLIDMPYNYACYCLALDLEALKNETTNYLFVDRVRYKLEPNFAVNINNYNNDVISFMIQNIFDNKLYGIHSQIIYGGYQAWFKGVKGNHAHTINRSLKIEDAVCTLNKFSKMDAFL